MRRQHRCRYSLHRRVIRHGARAIGVRAEELAFGGAECGIVPAAREPLRDAEDTVRVIHHAAELPDPAAMAHSCRGGPAERRTWLTSPASCSNTPDRRGPSRPASPAAESGRQRRHGTFRSSAGARWPALHRPPDGRSCQVPQRCTERAAPPARWPASAGRAPRTGSSASERIRRDRDVHLRRHHRTRPGSTSASPIPRPSAPLRASAGWSRAQAGCHTAKPRRAARPAASAGRFGRLR